MAGRTVRCPECDALVDVPPGTDEALDEEGPEGSHAGRTDRADPLPGTGGFPPTPTPNPATRGRGMAAVGGDVLVGGDEAVGGDVLVGGDVVETVLMDEADEDEAAFRRPPREEEELDMTPMVDVTFLLLIFFMVTASFSLQKSIQMPRQTSDLPSVSPLEEETEELDPVELEIDEFGGFFVITADFEEETPGKQNLIRTLKRAIGSATEGMQLKIRVHEMAKLQALVDAMDAGTIAGFAEIQVDQVEDL